MYGTLQDADAYHAARGRADWTGSGQDDRVAALVRGSDYVDQRYRGQSAEKFCAVPRFPGVRTAGRAQEREWPRTGAVDRYGDPIPDDEVPTEVEHAAYEAAYRELLQPGSLSPDYVPAQQVTRETVGPLTVQYSDTAARGTDNPLRPVASMIDDIIGPVTVKYYCGPAVRVV